MGGNFNRFGGGSHVDGGTPETGWRPAIAKPMLRPFGLILRSATARAYYSTVLPQPAHEIWEIIRDFNNYPIWVGGAG